MTVTVWGDCGGPNTIAASWDRYGRVTGACSYRKLDLDLPGSIDVDGDHDGNRLGQLLYAELGPDNRLRAVCVLDGDWLTTVDRPVYLSPAFEMRGRGIDRADTYIAQAAKMIGLSVTLNTARVAAQPVGRRAGDLRASVDRYGWPCGWQHTDPLLERALDHLGGDLHARARSATSIVDRREHPHQPAPDARPVRGPLEHRSATAVDVHLARREIDVLVAPAEIPTVIHERGRRYTETFAPGAFAGCETRPGRVKVNLHHQRERLVGKAVTLDPWAPEGLVGTLKLSRTRDADEALALIDDDLLGISAGFATDPKDVEWTRSRDHRRVRRALLHHIALVDEAAYETARITAVRSHQRALH